MTEYQFVKFEHQHTEIDSAEEWQVVAKSLRALLAECEFIVFDAGSITMSPCKEIVVRERYRGPSIHAIDDSEYTWWYNISGGYKLAAK